MSKKTRKHKRILIEIYDTLYNAFGPQYWWPGETPFEVIIGAILTQNTSWGNVEKAINNLKKNRVCSINSLYKMQNKQLAALIKPAGYFNIKAKRLKEFMNFLVSNYRGSVKKMRTEDTQLLRNRLLSVNGIGPETADSILLYALEKPVFVIDAYTKRIMQRHKLVSDKTTYHELQTLFHENLPQDTRLFNEYHALFVKLGKDYCKTKPKCSECPLRGAEVIIL